jgi:hypothetical protein
MTGWLQRSIQYTAASRFHHWRLGILDRPLSLMMTKSKSSLRAKRSNPCRNTRSKSGLLRRFAPLRKRFAFVAGNDVANPKHTSAFPRRESPELCLYASPKEGVALPSEGSGATPRGERGMPGARCTRSRACRIDSTRVSHHGRTGITRHSRTRWCYSLFRALLGDRALLSPSPVKSACRARQGRHRSFTNLTPASGRQDHTTSPSARLRSRQQRNSRPSHPDPTFVTIAKRPFVWAGMARICR